MENHSQWILLALAGLMYLLSPGSGAAVPFAVDKHVPLDQLLVKANHESTNGSNAFEFLEKTHLIRTEHDMVYTIEEWAELHNEAKRKKRTAGIIPNRRERRWRNNVVNYHLEANVFNERDVNEIQRAISELKHYTCLKFKETSTARNRIFIQKGFGGCYSRVGMVGGVQELGLSEGCRAKHIIIHELGHAIGLHHEQTRPDRDDHVTIRFDRIDDNMEHNFEKYGWDYIDTYGLPYDYLSMMHYGPSSFATQAGQVTIETVDPQYQDDIGTNPGLSMLDIRTLNNMHKCVPDSCTLKDEDCGEKGFVGKDCKCWCPGPTRNHPVEYCNMEDLRELGSLEWNHKCVDHHPDCAYFAAIGYCEEHVDSMLYFCEHTCKAC